MAVLQSLSTVHSSSRTMISTTICLLATLLSCQAFTSPTISRSHVIMLAPKKTTVMASLPLTLVSLPSRPTVRLSSSANDDNENSDAANEKEESIDVDLDSRLYKVRMPRAAGIDWGTDLSFSFVYVRELEPAGAASSSGEIAAGDQLCELQAVSEDSEPVNLLGASFDSVMTSFANLPRTVTDVDLVFFRGTTDELKAVCSGVGSSPEQETVTVTVIQNKGAKDEKVVSLQAPNGVNVRELLVDNGINVYQSVTRWTNCKGKQLCGTCIVNVAQGAIGTNRKSMDEDSTLRENPDSYRLSCVTFAYGDVTVETFPPVNAAQWTR